ncbi:MAG: SDR family NAD(P)-dependent oxidoreductase [Candidatus Muiribacteriota bacterium]
MNKYVVVTGGAGFIGSNLTVKLVDKGYKVIVVDDLSSGSLKNLDEVIDKIHFFNLDISNSLDVLNSYEKIEAVFHLGAIPSVPYSVKKPVHTNRVNLGGTLNLLEFARKKNIKKFIFSSSSAIYGENKEVNYESGQAAPLSPYGVEKLCSEKYVSLYNDIYNIDTISLRYFNVFGPKQNPYSEYSAVIPKFVKQIEKNENLIVYGDGKQTRDFVFVENVAEANIKALNSSINGEVVNIGTGKGISVNYLIEELFKIAKKEVKVQYHPQRKGDIKHSTSNIKKAEKILLYNPEISFRKGLKKTYRWYVK